MAYYKCPECGSEEEFTIKGSVWLRTDNCDFIDYEGFESTPKSKCVCCACMHEGKLKEFTREDG